MSDFENLSLAQIRDLGDKVGSSERAKRFLSGELVLVERERKASIAGQANGGVTYAKGIDTTTFLMDWSDYYRDVHGVRLDNHLSPTLLPQTRVGFGWGVVMVQDITIQQAFEALTRRFRTWKWCDDLDRVLDPKHEVRTTANGSYVVWCRDRIEADEELKNMSANQLKERVDLMTLFERVMLEGCYHWKTGGHLDIKNVTLCAGSRYSDGGVPSAYWLGFDSKFCVSRCGAGFRGGSIRAREVVSL